LPGAGGKFSFFTQVVKGLIYRLEDEGGRIIFNCFAEILLYGMARVRAIAIVCETAGGDMVRRL
jgi:hypothetical protein